MATLSDLRARNTAMPGTIIESGSTAVPSGWLDCDGLPYSRTTYANLFAAIGTNYGVGDGSTTFNVPDMRGRSPIGSGTGASPTLTARTIGTKLGAETVTLAETNVPSHTHTLAHTHTMSQSTSTSSDGAHAHSVSQSQLVQAPVGTSGYTSGGSGFNNAGTVSVGTGSSTHAHAFSVSMTTATQSASTTSTGSGSATAFSIIPPTLVVHYVIKT